MSSDTIDIDGLKVGPCMVRGYIERIAELEQQLLRSKANYFDLNSEFQQCLDCCKRVGELEADAEVREEANRSLLSFGMKTGMERAAEIITQLGKGRIYLDAIRKEIEK